jgi:hypothetical protein
MNHSVSDDFLYLLNYLQERALLLVKNGSVPFLLDEPPVEKDYSRIDRLMPLRWNHGDC